MDSSKPPKPDLLLDDLEAIRQLLEKEQLEPPLLTETLDDDLQIPVLSEIIEPGPDAPAAAPVEDRSWIKPRDNAPSVASAAPASSASRCDGRTHCSQMRSCEEATYFLQHCPNTQMDGDRDGVACERQWC